MPDNRRTATTACSSPPPTTATRDPEWLKIDWRKHLRRVDLPGAETSTTSRSAKASRSSSSTGSPAAGATGSRTSPTSAAATGRSRSTCPASATARCLPGRSRWPITAAWSTTSASGWGSTGSAALVGNSMGGFIATEAVIEEPERFDRLVLVSAAGISFAEWQGRHVRGDRRRIFKAAIPMLSGDRRSLLDPPAGPQARLRAGSSATRTSCGRSCSPSRCGRGCRRRLLRRAGVDLGLRHPRAAAGDRDPDAGRLGPQRPHRPGRGGARLPPPDPAAHAWSSSSAPATCRMLERPRRFNPLLEEFIESSQPLRAAAGPVGHGESGYDDRYGAA